MAKYLFFRTDRIGDFLVSAILIKSIKRSDKNSIITVIASEKNYNYIKNFSYVESDGAYIFQLKNITDIAEITEALKKSKIEIIDMQTLDTDLENVFLKLTGAK